MLRAPTRPRHLSPLLAISVVFWYPRYPSRLPPIRCVFTTSAPALVSCQRSTTDLKPPHHIVLYSSDAAFYHPRDTDLQLGSGSD
ncbi:hypothetical protein B0H17DRAFT_1039470 [Mycena rosella]|uniref:Uncharacterized protein n=1 Tax=Mycena rosella TaxID=1033263 RepID=A0AAD7GSN2_MYCRO|nr:hypothetical protein B0H17DRAFT_1039470 [Mycena rosella]